MRCTRRPQREAPAAAGPGEPGPPGPRRLLRSLAGEGAPRGRLGGCGIAVCIEPGRVGPLRGSAQGIVGTVVRPSARCRLRKGKGPARRTRVTSMPEGLGGRDAE